MRLATERIIEVGALALLLGWAASAAGETWSDRWNLTPRAGISQIFTDNIDLSPSGEEEDEAITTVDVGFRVDRSGARSSLDAAYNLQQVFYWQDTRGDDTFHQFLGQGDAEIVQNRFFVDASAAYGQRFVSPRGAAGDNVFGSDERTNVGNYRLSPYWQERFGTFAQSEVRYTFDKTDIDGDAVSDSSNEANRWRAFLASGPDFGRLGWRLSYDREDVDFDDGSSVLFESAEALASLRITSQLSTFAAAGREWNEFEADPSRARPDDEFWRAGVTWTPGPRTFMEAFYGERFFGDTYGATLRHQFRRSQVALDYTESPTTLTDALFTPVLFPVGDEFGDPVLDDDEPLFLDFELPELVSDVYISKRLTASASGTGIRTRFVLRGFDERREFQVQARDEHIYGVGANLSRRLTSDSTAALDLSWQEATFDGDATRDDERDYGARGSYTWRVASGARANVQASWRRTEFDIGNREDDLWSAGVGLSTSLGRQATAAVNYRYQQRDSTQAGREFEENRITFSLATSF